LRRLPPSITKQPAGPITKRRSIALFRQPPWVKYWYIFSMDTSEILCCTGKPYWVFAGYRSRLCLVDLLAMPVKSSPVQLSSATKARGWRFSDGVETKHDGLVKCTPSQPTLRIPKVTSTKMRDTKCCWSFRIDSLRSTWLRWDPRLCYYCCLKGGHYWLTIVRFHCFVNICRQLDKTLRFLHKVTRRIEWNVFLHRSR